MSVIEVTVLQAFPIYEPADIPNPQGLSIQDTLVFMEAIKINQKFEIVKNYFELNEYTNGDSSIINKTIVDWLYMTQHGARATTQTITQIFAMWDSSNKIKSYDIVTHNLNLIQTVIGLLAKPGNSTFTMNQIASYVAHRNINVPQTFTPKSYGKGYITDPNFNALTPVVLGGPNGSQEFVF
jgi:hypothetical protein